MTGFRNAEVWLTEKQNGAGPISAVLAGYNLRPLRYAQHWRFAGSAGLLSSTLLAHLATHSNMSVVIFDIRRCVLALLG
jgi:hypothetical protein